MTRTVEEAVEVGGRSGLSVAGGAGSGAGGGTTSPVEGEAEEEEDEAVALEEEGGTSGRISRLVSPMLGHFQERELQGKRPERVSRARWTRPSDPFEEERTV